MIKTRYLILFIYNFDNLRCNVNNQLALNLFFYIYILLIFINRFL
jgi:hypothetical protein